MKQIGFYLYAMIKELGKVKGIKQKDKGINMIKSTATSYIGNSINTGGVGITGNIIVTTPCGRGV